MTRVTHQMMQWAGDFGKQYTDRNALTFREMEALYKRSYGITRSALNKGVLENVGRSSRILEVGSNIGNQLICLQKMGFSDLYGIELQRYAVKLSKSTTRDINIIQGSAFDIPYKDGHFDLVFTSGLLIHISPSDIAEVMHEIHRCSHDYIWGLEYWASEFTGVTYRQNDNMLWKAYYARIYLGLFDDLELVREERLKYRDNENVDSMFLLRKKANQSILLSRSQNSLDAVP